MGLWPSGWRSSMKGFFTSGDKDKTPSVSTWYDVESFKQWVCVYKGGVSWRRSPDMEDRDGGSSVTQGDSIPVIKIDKGKPKGSKFVKGRRDDGSWKYLPCNTPDGLPVMRPDFHTLEEERAFQVVYAHGVSWRCGPHYDDRDSSNMAAATKGTIVQGRPFLGFTGTTKKKGSVQMIKVGIGKFLPVSTPEGTL